MYENGKIVCTGFWYYDTTAKTGVAIQKMPVIYGSGDYEDPDDIQNDREIENYYIWFASADSLVEYKSGAGYELSLEEAKIKAEKLVGQRIEWTDSYK